MEEKKPTLFIEINDLNFIFVAAEYDKNQNIKIKEKFIAPNEGIAHNKIINIDSASKIIKKNVELIETKLNYIFKDLILIIDSFDTSCINISGFKKLNGSQILKDNISYILNSLKSVVTENEKKKTIIHIFNSKSILDGIQVDNLPIGLFGNFYTHELTFFLIEDNDLKNMNQIFNKVNLKINKVILKSFIEGTQLINQNKDETFFKIKINKSTSNVSFFEKSSFRYSENFSFGTDIIFKDVTKICSINHEMITHFLSSAYSENRKFNNTDFLEEKYFTNTVYRKIRKKLIVDIIDARIEEIINIVFSKNINIQSFKKNNIRIFVTIKDRLIKDKFKFFFKSHFLKELDTELDLIDDFKIDPMITNTAGISTYGWKKEAIPIIQPKSSIITRVFKSIFE